MVVFLCELKMKCKLKKSAFNRRGLYLNYSLVIPLIASCSYAEMSGEVLTEIHNKLCYIDWAITAHEKIQNAKDDDFFKEQQFKVSKYRESIVNVIGHAIADCVTHQNEFHLTKDDGSARLIVFTAEPKHYSRENFNAVLLYNLVEQILHNDEVNAENEDFNIGQLLNNIRTKFIEDYESDIEEYSDNEIDALYSNLDNAIKDMLQYNARLDLARNIQKFWTSGDLSKTMKVASQEYSIAKLENEYEKVEQDKTTLEFPLNRIVCLNPGHRAAPEVRFNVTLRYDPNATIGEEWSLTDSGDLKIGTGEFAKTGYFHTVIPFYWNINSINYFIQFVECDLELDASALRDCRYWRDRQNEEYFGKILSFNSIEQTGSTQYVRKHYHNLIKNKDILEQYFTSYKRMEPSKRALKPQG